MWKLVLQIKEWLLVVQIIIYLRSNNNLVLATGAVDSVGKLF